MNMIITYLEQFNNIVWTYLLPVAFLALGILLTIKLKGFPQRHILYSIKHLISTMKQPPQPLTISPVASLALALSATLGIGNIVGVLTAIRLGGPGALFWMWIVGIIGMTLKYSETTLSMRYRVKISEGHYTGGPMFYLRDGAGSKLLANIFAVSTMLGILLGIGTFPQVHSVIEIFTYTFDTPLIITSVVLTISIGAITLGGLKSISRIASIVMPIIMLLFIFGSLYLLVRQMHLIPAAFSLIFNSAFKTTALASGTGGYAVKVAIEHGTRRGIFSNESGLGSAAIAAATAANKVPAKQGLVHVLEVVIDTLIINTLVGLLVIISGVYTSTGQEQALLNLIFEDPLYIGQITMTVSLLFFAFTTIIAWSYYGSQCAYFMWGHIGQKLFRYLFIVVIFLASFVDLTTIWTLADFTTFILVIPNIIGLYLLRNNIVQETVLLESEMLEKKEHLIDVLFSCMVLFHKSLN